MNRIGKATLVAIFACMLWAPSALALNPFEKSTFDLDQSDLEAIQAATQPYFDDDTVAPGTVREWSNAETGNSGTATLLERFEHDGMPCRRIQHDITIEDVADKFRYIIDRCQVADGSWKLL